MAGTEEDYLSGIGVHGSSSIVTGTGDDRIKATNLFVSSGSSIKTGKGDDSVQAGKLYLGGELDTGDGGDVVEADKFYILGNSAQRFLSDPYNMLNFEEYAGGSFLGINAYRKIMMSGQFDPEELAATRQEYLEERLRDKKYGREIE